MLEKIRLKNPVLKKKNKILVCGVAQSEERATPGEEVLGFIPAVAARFLLVGSVSG